MKKRLNIMEKHIIEQRADRVLEAYGYIDGDNHCVYVDSVRLARFFGFEVRESSELSATEDGYITVSEDATERNIIVNDNRSIETKRFIITHELAHFLLHYQKNGKFFKHRENVKGKNSEENDADYFAACLLMPKKNFESQYNLLRKNKDFSYERIINELQLKFGTPRESIERRINEVTSK